MAATTGACDLLALIERALAAGQQVDPPLGSGAKHIFDYWPDEKIAAGNIGAIKISPDRSSLGPFPARLCELPSEVSPGNWSKRWRAIDSRPIRQRRGAGFPVWPDGGVFRFCGRFFFLPGGLVGGEEVNQQGIPRSRSPTIHLRCSPGHKHIVRPSYPIFYAS